MRASVPTHASWALWLLRHQHSSGFQVMIDHQIYNGCLASTRTPGNLCHLGEYRGFPVYPSDDLYANSHLTPRNGSSLAPERRGYGVESGAPTVGQPNWRSTLQMVTSSPSWTPRSRNTLNGRRSHRGTKLITELATSHGQPSKVHA